MTQEKISVAICTYCGERYIARQLQSIIQQDRPVQEIVLYDDGSTDRTTELADAILAKSGIAYRLVRNQQTLGVTKNFEACISACSGDLIFTADQDDIWAPEKVRRLLEAFQDPQVVMAYSDARIVDAEGCELRPSLYRRDGFWPEPFTQETFQDAVVRLSQTVYGCTMAFRGDFVRKILPFYPSMANHDAWIMCCAPLFGKVIFLPEPLMSYRIHGGNTVASVGGSRVWDEICAAQDEFDAHFAIQPLRGLRLELLREAARRSADRLCRSGYCRRIDQANCLYEMLPKIKTCGKMSGVAKLTASLLDGCYHYRFCDRGVRTGKIQHFKQFVNDIRYLLHR